MSIQKYSVNQHPIQTILTWVKSGEIAIPEVQRLFTREELKQKSLDIIGKYSSDVDFNVNHDTYLTEIYAEVNQ
ncbi:MAG: hypothetical protein AAF639_28600 [Chloroflexota bacterium]